MVSNTPVLCAQLLVIYSIFYDEKLLYSADLFEVHFITAHILRPTHKSNDTGKVPNSFRLLRNGEDEVSVVVGVDV